MKIALLGYGKMGKIIEEIALSRGHQIVLRKTSESSFDGLEKADVAIDFSVPSAAVRNISECLHTNVPIVSGTTGWLDEYPAMVDLCQKQNGAFIYGSNFSLGVNIFFELNRHLACVMAQFEQYRVSMEEIHHTQKLDAPSGTAISLAQGIIKESDYADWALKNTVPPHQQTIEIDALRIENVPGTHSITYDSDIDAIEIKHIAHNRKGFALGAVVAAEWLVGKKGVYTMKEVLNL
jgi:4-hydroxy-tetrahydrodipicolinate reductase